MAVEEQKIPYHVMAISELAKNYSAAAFRVEISQCREVIAKLVAEDTALGDSPMYQYIRSTVKLGKETDVFGLDLLAARMYLAGRFDQRGAPSAL